MVEEKKVIENALEMAIKSYDKLVVDEAGFQSLAFTGETAHPDIPTLRRIWFIQKDGVYSIFDLTAEDFKKFIEHHQSKNREMVSKGVIKEEKKEGNGN